MFKLGSSSRDERSYVIFDVGADSVGVCVGVCGSDGDQLLWHRRLGYAFQDAANYVQYERSMYATLLEVGMSLMSEGFRIAQHNERFDAHHLKVVCVLAPPWFLGTVGSAVRKKENVFEVTQSVLDEMRSEMFSEFLATPESVSWKDVMGTPQLMEQYETEVRFDGYPVNNYKGRSTGDLELHTYLALVSDHVLEQVQDIVHRVLPNQNLLLTTSSRLFAGCATNVKCVNARRALLLELGGQITSITFFSNSAFKGVATIPYGTHHLLHQIAPKAVSTKEARSKLDILMKKSGAGEDGTVNLPDQVVAPLREWGEAVSQAAVALTGGVVPPRLMYLMAGEPWYSLYSGIFSVLEEDGNESSSNSFVVASYVKGEESGEDQKVARGPKDSRLLALVQAVDEAAAAHE